MKIASLSLITPLTTRFSIRYSRYFWLLLAGLLFSFNASASENTHAEVKAVYSASKQAIVGTFIQTKQIKALKRPFISKGQFHYEPGLSFLWLTQEPIQSGRFFTPDGVYLISPDGTKTLEVQLASSFFFALLEGNVEQLRTYFHVKERDSCIFLTPKDEKLNKLFSQVELCLSATQLPETITLTESSGNTTNIRLSIDADDKIEPLNIYGLDGNE